MREFKFRIWDISNKKWLKDEEIFIYKIKSMIDLSGRIYTYIENGGGEDNVEYLGDKYEINQYTGLKDTNGVEIYEGDVLWNEYDECYGEVTFDEGEWKFEDSTAIQNLFQILDSVQVMGNIYENKEFLRD